jgi:hypothetical protein
LRPLYSYLVIGLAAARRQSIRRRSCCRNSFVKKVGAKKLALVERSKTPAERGSRLILYQLYLMKYISVALHFTIDA